MVDSHRQSMLRVRPAQRAAGPVMAESQGVVAHGPHAGTACEVEPSDGPMMGLAMHRIVITRGTRYMEGTHPVLGKEAHAVQLTAIGQHSVETGLASRIHDALGPEDTGLAHIRAAQTPPGKSPPPVERPGTAGNREEFPGRREGHPANW